MPIILRQDKGAPLTHDELDGNFESLDSDMQSVSTLVDNNFNSLDSDIGDRVVIGEVYDWGRYEDTNGSSISVSGFSSLASTPTVTVAVDGGLESTISQSTLLGAISISVHSAATNPSWLLSFNDFTRGHSMVVSLKNDAATAVQFNVSVAGAVAYYKSKNYENNVNAGTTTLFVLSHLPQGVFLSSSEEFTV